MTSLQLTSWTTPVLNPMEDSTLSNWNLSESSENLTNLTGGFEDYSYDYDDAVARIPLQEVIPVSLAYSITLVFGISGNVLVIFAVCRYKRLRSITNAFLTSLASADLLLVLICVPVKCASFFSFTWAFGEFLCKFVHYMQTVSMICSVMTLTVMSIERFIAIIFPLRAKYLCTNAHARVVIAVVWVLSFCMAIPILIGQFHKPVGVVRKAFWCVKEWPKKIFGVLFEVYMLVIIFIIPICVMVIAYTGICIELSKVSKMRTTMGAVNGGVFSKSETTPIGGLNGRTIVPIYRQPNRMCREPRQKRSKLDEDKTKVIQMLIVVVIMFAICWGPILINNLLVALGLLQELHLGYLKPMRQAFFLMSYMNSCTNPVVYGFMSKNFRQSFKHAIFSCFRPGRGRRDLQHQSFGTRNTAVHGSSMLLSQSEAGCLNSSSTTSPRVPNRNVCRYNTRF